MSYTTSKGSHTWISVFWWRKRALKNIGVNTVSKTQKYVHHSYITMWQTFFVYTYYTVYICMYEYDSIYLVWLIYALMKDCQNRIQFEKKILGEKLVTVCKFWLLAWWPAKCVTRTKNMFQRVTTIVMYIRREKKHLLLRFSTKVWRTGLFQFK